MSSQREDVIRAKRPVVNQMNTPLLGSETSMQGHDYEDSTEDKRGTMAGSIINLVNTVIGSGVLGLPFAFKLSGLLLGNFFIFLVVILSIQSVKMIIVVEQAHRKPGVVSSYSSLARLSLGEWGVHLSDVMMVVNCFGAMTSYLIIIASFVNPIFSQTFNINLDDYRSYVILISLLVLIPLSSLKNMESLKYTSVLAMVSICYLWGLVMYRGGESLSKDSFNDCQQFGCSRLGNFDTGFLRTIPIICFAFTCHMNVLPIFNELKDGSPAKFQMISASAQGFCALVYAAVASFGYMTFYECTKSNILNTFPDDDIAVTIARAGMTMTVTFSFPVLAYPAVQTIETALKVSFSYPKHVGILIVLVALAVIVAITVEDVSLIFGISGSVAGTMLSFILPGLFFIKLDPNKHQTSSLRIQAYLMVILGTVFMIAALIFTILDFIDKSDDGQNPLCNATNS